MGMLTAMALEVRVDGSVADASVIQSTDEAFDDPALSAVVRWKFRPGDGRGTMAPGARFGCGAWTRRNTNR